MKCFFSKKRSRILALYVLLLGFFLVLNVNTGIAKNGNAYLGSWETTINSPQGISKYFVHISKKQSGGLSATIDNPETGFIDIPVENIEIKNNKLVLEIARFKGRFIGQLKNESKKLEGQFQSGEILIPIVFTPANEESQHYRKPRFNRSGKKQLSYKYSVPRKLDDDWDTSSFKVQGIDESKIESMMDAILNETYSKIHSVLVVKKGKLIVEEYFYSFNQNNKHGIHSDTKSFTSALIGIAIDQGHIVDLNIKLSDYFEEYAELFQDEDKSKIDLKHLLTMTGGFAWDETSFSFMDPRNSHVAMNNDDNQIRYILERPMQYQPGETFRYNSALSIVLGEIIRRTTSHKADKFAEKYLFGPLGISDYIWSSYPNGTVQTGGGLRMIPRDMAKFGYLFLSGGIWKGKRIISEKWIDESTKEHVNLSYLGYGYQWWRRTFFDIKTNTTIKSFFAWGYGGQYIFVLPELDAVIVFTGGNYLERQKAKAPFEMLENYIIPALLSNDIAIKQVS